MADDTRSVEAGYDATGGRTGGEAGRVVGRLSDFDDLEVADGYPDVRGWDVLARDGQSVGKVKDLIVDASAMRTLYVEVELDDSLRASDAGGAGREADVLLPVGKARLDERDDEVLVDSLTVEQVVELPRVDERMLAGSDTDFSRTEFDEERFYGGRRPATSTATGTITRDSSRTGAGRGVTADLRGDEAAGEAVGGVGGAVVGGAIGAAGGPVGVVIGAIAGALGGWWLGRAAVDATELTPEDEAYFRQEFTTRTGATGGTRARRYEQARPAYQLGTSAALNPDYSGRPWSDVEPELARAWSPELAREYGPWDDVREYVRIGFERSRTRTPAART